MMEFEEPALLASVPVRADEGTPSQVPHEHGTFDLRRYVP